MCIRQLVQLQELTSELDSLGYQVLAVSPGPAEDLIKAATRSGVTFPLLADPGLKVSQAFGLAFGAPGRELPVPAVYVLDREGRIHFEYVNPNYAVRLHPDVLTAAARAAAGG
ncbi:peroxiredoxin family protein [Candidatus Latescibacterota bacterium]